MTQPCRLELVRPQNLTFADEALWNGFVAARTDLTGPYFDIRYIKAIGGHVPQSGVVRFRQGDLVAGFFPYQIRSGTLQPMGAPLTDYHGVIAAADLDIDFDALLKVTGARRLEFQGWVGAMSGQAATSRLTRRIADTRDGFDAWWHAQDQEHHKFFKNIGRCQRNVEKDFGGFDFSWERVTPAVLDWVLDLKRQQYRKTGMHDVFGCGWTRTLLDDLAACDSCDFGLRAGVFRHDGKIVAAEISLTDRDEVHLWFPSYDPDYYRYTVGILLTIAIMKHAASLGIKRFDFGTGGEDYKSPLTVAAGPCLEGELNFHPHPVSVMMDRAGAGSRFDTVRQALKRRVKVIRATEIGLAGWTRAMLSLGQRAFMRLGELKAEPR